MVTKRIEQTGSGAREWKVFSTFPALATEPSKGGHAQTCSKPDLLRSASVNAMLFRTTDRETKVCTPREGWSLAPIPTTRDSGSRSLQRYCCSLSRFRSEVINGPASVTEHKLTGEAATQLSSFAGEGLVQGLQILIGPGLGA